METNDRTLNHISNVITSLNKNFKSIYLGKPLKNSELYLYDIIFNFIEGCHIKLSESQLRQLRQMYNRLPSVSDQVCQSFIKQEFQNKAKFTQAESKDIANNNTPYKVYYGQDNVPSRTPEQVYNFMSGTLPSLPYSEFNQGVKIDYTEIGKLIFDIQSPGDKQFAIYDILNNDVTDGFERFYNSTTKNVTYVSILNYSYGNIQFKIK